MSIPNSSKWGYNIWKAMKARCYNPKATCYESYGGRGVSVCDRWLNSLDTFMEDMGKRPSMTHTVERIDNSKNYTPENCVWATPKQQGLNKRNNVWITYEGVTALPEHWAEVTGFKRDVIYDRAKKGWSAEEIIKTPLRHRRGNYNAK